MAQKEYNISKEDELEELKKIFKRCKKMMIEMALRQEEPNEQIGSLLNIQKSCKGLEND